MREQCDGFQFSFILTSQLFPTISQHNSDTMPKKESELVSLRNVDTSDDDGEEDHLIKHTNPVVIQPTEDDLLLESSTLEDVFAAINDAKYIAPLVALCVLLVGMYLATDPFRPVQQRTPRLSHDEFVSDRCTQRQHSLSYPLMRVRFHFM